MSLHILLNKGQITAQDKHRTHKTQSIYANLHVHDCSAENYLSRLLLFMALHMLLSPPSLRSNPMLSDPEVVVVVVLMAFKAQLAMEA